MSRSLPWALAALLILVQGALGFAAWQRARVQHTTYVFTPMVDVVPGGAPLTAGEAEALQVDVRRQVDARDMQSAYARLGATLSLDDLLRGVEALDREGKLSDGDRECLRAILDAAREEHREAVDVQRKILDQEAAIAAEVAATLAALPPDVRERVEARATGPGKRK